MSSFDLWDTSIFKITQSFHICIANVLYCDQEHIEFYGQGSM